MVVLTSGTSPKYGADASSTDGHDYLVPVPNNPDYYKSQDPSSHTYLVPGAAAQDDGAVVYAVPAAGNYDDLKPNHTTYAHNGFGFFNNSTDSGYVDVDEVPYQQVYHLGTADGNEPIYYKANA